MPLHGQAPGVKIWLLVLLLAATAFGQEVRQILVHGIPASATLEQAQKILGKPECLAESRLEKEWRQPGTFAQWGGQRPVGQGEPTLLFSPGGQLLAAVGHTFDYGGKAFKLGSKRTEIDTLLGAPDSTEAAGQGEVFQVYQLRDCRFKAIYDKDNQLLFAIRESPQFPEERSILFYRRAIGIWLNGPWATPVSPELLKAISR